MPEPETTTLWLVSAPGPQRSSWVHFETVWDPADLEWSPMGMPHRLVRGGDAAEPNQQCNLLQLIVRSVITLAVPMVIIMAVIVIAAAVSTIVSRLLGQGDHLESCAQV